MRLFLIMLSMMFAILVMAIPIEVDVGKNIPVENVFIVNEPITMPTDVFFERPMGNSQSILLNHNKAIFNNDIESRVDYGSINRFVYIYLINDIKNNDISYKGFSFGNMNKLL